jgi:multisubunit Na+/H+ antiporter MnhB subunit
MIDIFDILAFLAFAVLLAAAVIIIVALGSLPGRIAQQRGHPQAAAINVASWLGVATLGLLWPLAFIWAFLKPSSAAAVNQEPRPAPDPDANAQLVQMQARVDGLEAILHDLQAEKEVRS